MSLSIPSQIADLSVNNLNLTGAGNASQLLYRASGNAIVGNPIQPGIALSNSNPMYFGNTECYISCGSIVQSPVGSQTDYTISLGNTDTYPYLYFECFCSKSNSDGQAAVTMFCGSASTGTDFGTNYLQVGYYQSSTIATTGINTTATGIPIANVYSSVATSTLRQSIFYGTAVVKSGGMRIFNVVSTSANVNISGPKNMRYKWTNTADLMSHVLVRVPPNVNVWFNAYQRQ